jgi:hypothetical protein
MNTAASVALVDFVHHRSMQGTIGSGSTVTNQYGYFADSSMTGATNNFGFYGNIPTSSNRWNLYMNGTAKNYLAGSLLIGSTTDAGYKLDVTGTTRLQGDTNISSGSLGIGTTSLTAYNLKVEKNITGATVSYGISSGGVIQSDVTSVASMYMSVPNTQPTTFTLATLNHYNAYGSTFGSGSTVNNQVGFRAENNLTGAVQNFGFYGNIPTASGRWNLFMLGTAPNYMSGSLGIGTTAFTFNTASALLQVDSTTQGVLFPRMTTTQKNAISSPATGLVVFDTTLGKLCVYSTTWQTITSL